MKTRYMAVIAAAAAILAFSGCGDTGEGFVDKNEPKTTSSQSAVNDVVAENADQTPAPAADVTSAAAESVPADPVIDSNAAPTADSSESSAEVAPAVAGDKVFNTPTGERTFDSLHADGLANTAGGKWYCIVPSDAGAGHMYYQSYYSTNGTDWNQGNMYDEANGENYHYALPDGRILVFNTNGPIASNVPVVSAVSLGDDNSVKSAPVDNFFNNQFLDDGSQLSATEGLTFYVTYNGGYNFTFSFTDMNGIIVYNVNTDLDETSLLMKE